MALIVAKRVGAFLGRVIDSLTAPAAISAAAVFPVEYVTNLKRKHEIRLAVGRVLERERERVLESQRDVVMELAHGKATNNE